MFALAGVALLGGVLTPIAKAQDKSRPNVVVLVTGDTGRNDFGAYDGGVNLGHPTKTNGTAIASVQ
jgi:hypothetical protein